MTQKYRTLGLALAAVIPASLRAIMVRTEKPTGAPLVSVITAVFNNIHVVGDALQSVQEQDYPNIEHILIDGGSTDGTFEFLNARRAQLSYLISEPDTGIYDALNKGIKVAQGEYIAILHSDDVFDSPHVISALVESLEQNGADVCCSDVVITDRQSNSIQRFYMAHYFRNWLLRIGWMPPHPGLLIRRSIHERFGVYDTQYKIAGDFDFLVRIFLSDAVSWTYLNQVTTKMRTGGASNSGIRSKLNILREQNSILRRHGFFSSPLLLGLRYPLRFFELFARP